MLRLAGIYTVGLVYRTAIVVTNSALQLVQVLSKFANSVYSLTLGETNNPNGIVS